MVKAVMGIGSERLQMAGVETELWQTETQKFVPDRTRGTETGYPPDWESARVKLNSPEFRNWEYARLKTCRLELGICQTENSQTGTENPQDWKSAD